MLLWRSWHAGVRLDANGITVWNFWSQRHIAWTVVSHLADGVFTEPNGGVHWALCVVLQDGSTVKANWVINRQLPAPSTLELLRQAAARYGINAELTGELP